MPDNNTVERAEQRVREMDRVTRQFSEQGNRYMQQMMNRRAQITQDAIPDNGNDLHNTREQVSGQVSGQVSRQVGKNGTRFEPVERKKDVPAKTAEAPKNEEKNVPRNTVRNGGIPQSPNQGIDGEKLLLFALMYLLIMENADIKLILAIAYLIL